MKNHPHLKHQPQSELDWFQALTSLARFLRTPEGCPWDRQQKAQDFARYLGEEAQELQEAFQTGDNQHIQEELGDALFTLLATAAAAEEEGRFTLKSALQNIHEKMIRRHDHVFGNAKAQTPEDAVRIWNAIKQKERQKPPES